MKKIGLIGAGWVSEHHLSAYRDLAGKAVVVAIADPSAEARERRASEFGIARCYADAAQMLAQEDLDAVDIASPRECHVEHVVLAMERGLAIMCQKPMAPTLREAETLVARVGARVPMMVHENWRWRPHYRQIRRWIEAGRIARPLQTQMKILTSGLLRDARGELPALVRQPMMRELERMLLMEVMIHHVDCLRFLLGDLTLEASALGTVCPDIRGEDHASLCLKTTQGGVAVLTGNFCARGYPPEQTDDLEIVGEAGTIRLRGNVLELLGEPCETVTLDLAANYTASYRNAIGHFLDRLEDGGAFETGPEDNLKTLRIVEEVYRTAGL